MATKRVELPISDKDVGDVPQSEKANSTSETLARPDALDPRDFPDSLKAAILHDISQWALENRERLHRARKSLVAFAVFTVFLCIVGLTPNGFEAYGIRIDQFPDPVFYGFVALVNVYLYWSYHNLFAVSEALRKMMDDVYRDIIGFDYTRAASFNASRFARVSYNIWRKASPLIACTVAVAACGFRLLS